MKISEIALNERYKDSVDATEAMEQVQDYFSNEDVIQWVKDTQQQYDTDVQQKFENAKAAFDEFVETMMASGA